MTAPSSLAGVQPVAGRRHADLGVTPVRATSRHDRSVTARGIWVLDVDGQRLVDRAHGADGPEPRPRRARGPGCPWISIHLAPATTPTPRPLLKGALPCEPDSSSPCPSQLAAVVIIGGVALATPAVGLTSTPIANGTLDPVNVHVKNRRLDDQAPDRGLSPASRSSRTRWSPAARSDGTATPARASINREVR